MERLFPQLRQSSREFISFLNTKSLSQLVTKPTHKHGKILDLFITSCVHKVQQIDVREPLGSTCDHNMIEISLITNLNKTNNKSRKLNYFAADYSKINTYLSVVDWTSILNSSSDINSLYSSITDIIQESISRYVPFCRSRSRPKLPSHLRSLLNKKKRLYKSSKIDSSAKTAYKVVENQYRKASKEYVKQQEEKVILSNNRNCLYKFINKKLGKTNQIPPLRSSNNQLVIDSTEKANIFNSYFASIFHTDNGSNPPLSMLTSNIEEMPFFHITPNDVQIAINSIKISASRTPDNIPAIYIKKAAKHLIKPLADFFNFSLCTGQVPKLWKEAIVVPIHKKGLKNDPSNFRPISLTSILCRILEKIIHNKLIHHLMQNKLISDAQHGFLQRRSTLSQQVKLLNTLTKNYDHKSRLDMIYLDFSKAFDRVSHNKLVYILDHLKVNSKVITWITNYLSERSQRTVVDDCFSTSKPVNSGVPQGSVLGPLLFILFVEDLLQKISTSCTSTTVFGFADDIKLLGNNRNELQDALNIIGNWTKDWQQLIQPAKSEHITFNHNHNLSDQFKFNINGNNITKVHTVKDLGILISDNLKWTPYLNQIKSKASRLCCLILRSFKTNNLETYKTAYNTYIRPIMEYNTSIWTPHLKSEIKLIESVQQKFTKSVCKKLNLSFNNYSERLNIMGMESLECRRVRFDLILLYKMYNNLIDVNLDNFFQPSLVQNKYNLRRHKCTLVKPPIAKTATRYKFFTYRIINLWNKLPEEVVTSRSLNLFKFRLQQIDLMSMYEFALY